MISRPNVGIARPTLPTSRRGRRRRPRWPSTDPSGSATTQASSSAQRGDRQVLGAAVGMPSVARASCAGR